MKVSETTQNKNKYWDKNSFNFTEMKMMIKKSHFMQASS